MESLSLDDNQLEMLMNKSDLSDLDQIDTKTITGSCSSDEESSYKQHVANGGKRYNEQQRFDQRQEWSSRGYPTLSSSSSPSIHRGGPHTDQPVRCEGQDIMEEGSSQSSQVSTSAEHRLSV